MRPYPKLGQPIQPRSNNHYVPVHQQTNTYQKLAYPSHSYEPRTLNKKNDSIKRHNTVSNNNKPYNKIPNDVFDITREQFRLVKCLHHLKTLQNSTPKTWKKWGSNIVENLHLAFETSSVKSMFETLTNEFIESIRLKAIEHYNTCASEASVFLFTNSNRMQQSVFNLSINLVKKWAKNQLSKLNAETLSEALSTINSAYQSQTCASKDPLTISVTEGRRFVKITKDVSSVQSSSDNTSVTVNCKSTASKSVATSIKQIKPNNSCRFFIHSKQLTPIHEESSVASNIQQPQKVANTEDRNVLHPIIIDEDNSSESLSQGSCSNFSQTSILSYTHGGPPPSTGLIVHRSSMDSIANNIIHSGAKNILIGDENWASYIPPPELCDFSVYICSGKITAIRAIIDKVKSKVNLNKVIICISSNNYDSTSALSLLRNISKGLCDKFINRKIFICLAGICSSLSTDNCRALEAINLTLRDKSNKFIIIQPPDNFSTTNGYSFTDKSRNDYYNVLSSFLV